jgi:geranylgeranylglycerol-phosphate geranylgeranyltransferase|tara:strand:+ start:694 stop:1461 length:768 start_codon:yes stop_codon:yes gene_type:complete
MGVNELVELTRPKAVLMAVLGVLLVAFAAKADYSNLNLMLSAIISIACITSAGNAINDYYDVKIDKVNRPDRPIPSGRISSKSTKIFAFSLFMIGILASLPLPFLCILIAISNTILLLIYSSLFKRGGFLGNIFVGYLAASVFVFGSAIGGNIRIGVLLAILVFLAISAREVLKDLEDVKGDRVGGAKTLPINRGVKKAKVIVMSFLLLFILFSPVPYFAEIFSIYYLALILIPDLLFVRVIFRLFKKLSVKIPW